MKDNKIVLALLILVSLSSCGTEVTSEPQEINVLMAGLAQQEERTFFRTFVRLFEAENGIRVNLQYESNDAVYASVEDQISGEQIQTDVIMVDTANMLRYSRRHYVESLDFLNQYSDRTFTNLFDDYTHNQNERFFAPVSFDIYLTLFNKQALPYMPSSVDVIRDEQNQITQVDNITWQEIGQWAKNIRDETDEARFGFPYGRVSSQLIYPITGLASAMGSHSLPAFDDEGAFKAWEFLELLHTQDAIRSDASMGAYAHPTELLNSENLWISFAHMGPLGSVYKANPERYILGPTPSDEVTKQAGSTAGAWGYGIVKDSPNLSNSKKWIEFISDPEINYLYCSGLGGVISPLQEVRDFVAESLVDKIMLIGLQMFSENSNIHVVDTTDFVLWNDVKLLYNDLYEAMLLGESIDETRLNAYQASLDALRK